jgi:tetratricopeptide (TPR) repeat protein
VLYQLLKSEKPQERQMGRILTSLEYENLVTAVNLALSVRASIRNFFAVLSTYLDMIQDYNRGLELGQLLSSYLETYSPEELVGEFGIELVLVIDNIASRQLMLKQYSVAEASYQKALTIWLDNKIYAPEIIKRVSAGTYHNLGRVAREQQQWVKAMDNYQHALQILIEFNDQSTQADTYKELGSMFLDRRQWEKAQQYLQKALQIKIECNERYEQAGIYLNIGIASQHQQEWEQAENCYQQALEIYIEYSDRFKQADIYYQLGRIYQDQQEWEQAEQYYQYALQIYIEFKDTNREGLVLQSLARLWKASGDTNLPAAVAPVLGTSVEEAEKLLREALAEE